MNFARSLFFATVVAGVLGATVNATAQNSQPAPSTQPGSQAPQGQQHPQGGMGMGGMNGMMGMMNMMGQMDPAQMNRMMENCNKMMESSAAAPGQPSGGAPKGT